MPKQSSHVKFTCSSSTIETLEKGVKDFKSQQWRHYNVNDVLGVFIVNFEHISHLFPVNQGLLAYWVQMILSSLIAKSKAEDLRKPQISTGNSNPFLSLF